MGKANCSECHHSVGVGGHYDGALNFWYGTVMCKATGQRRTGQNRGWVLPHAARQGTWENLVDAKQRNRYGDCSLFSRRPTGEVASVFCAFLAIMAFASLGLLELNFIPWEIVLVVFFGLMGATVVTAIIGGSRDRDAAYWQESVA